MRKRGRHNDMLLWLIFHAASECLQDTLASFIRCNTLKVNCNVLKSFLEKKPADYIFWIREDLDKFAISGSKLGM